MWFDDDGHNRGLWNLSIFKFNKQLLNQHFIRILNSWIALPTKNSKLNVQRTKMILQYLKALEIKCFCIAFFKSCKITYLARSFFSFAKFGGFFGLHHFGSRVGQRPPLINAPPPFHAPQNNSRQKLTKLYEKSHLNLM